MDEKQCKLEEADTARSWQFIIFLGVAGIETRATGNPIMHIEAPFTAATHDFLNVTTRISGDIQIIANITNFGGDHCTGEIIFEKL
jgi:hypothetical protein